MTSQKHTASPRLYARLLTYVKPFGLMLAIGIAANIVYTGIDAGLTYMVKKFLDQGLIALDMPFIKTIPFILFFAITARGVTSAVGGYCMTSVARSVVMVLRQAVFAHLLKLPAKNYDVSSSGQLLSKILYDVEQVAQVSADALTDLVQNVFLVIGLLSVMMILCWQLSLMFLVTVPFVGLIVNATNKRVRRLSHRVQETMGEVTQIASEAIEGYRVVRIFGGESYETEKFNRASQHSRRQDMKVAVSKAINVAGVQGVLALGIALIILAAIALASSITVSAGAFVAITAAMLQLIKPLKTLTTLNVTFQRGLAGAESIFTLLDQVPERAGGILLPKTINGEVRFEKVSFAYRPDELVLKSIDFIIPAGKTVALVGHSGSGKSTLASLLPCFYTPTCGRILIDGVNIADVTLADLRCRIAQVSQHVTLFNDTVANNIAYGAFSPDRQSIIEAAKRAFADEFIVRLPQGYDTPVGENGVLLSGGQRQRLAIARAILKNAPILILDEATSALDTESEQMIQAALEVVMKNRTTIVIAHRLSTIKNADKIIVLNQGVVVEEGTHDALLAHQGYYAKLYQPDLLTREEIVVE